MDILIFSYLDATVILKWHKALLQCFKNKCCPLLCAMLGCSTAYNKGVVHRQPDKQRHGDFMYYMITICSVALTPWVNLCKHLI